MDGLIIREDGTGWHPNYGEQSLEDMESIDCMFDDHYNDTFYS